MHADHQRQMHGCRHKHRYTVGTPLLLPLANCEMGLPLVLAPIYAWDGTDRNCKDALASEPHERQCVALGSSRCPSDNGTHQQRRGYIVLHIDCSKEAPVFT